MRPTRLNVLLMDNNPTTASLVMKLLHYLHYDVQQVFDTTSLQHISHAPFDLLLLNLTRNVRPAHELAAILKLLKQQTSVICYTSELQINDFNQALKASGKGHWMQQTQLYTLLKNLELHSNF